MIDLPIAKAFTSAPSYLRGDYKLLPFRFMRYDLGRYLLTNLVGEYVLVNDDSFQALVGHKLEPRTETYEDLKARHFLYDEASDVALDLLAAKYRTRQSGLAAFTSLHLFVVTLRCDHSCPYCQVSRVSEDRGAYDMTPEIADKAIDLMFRSPAKHVKVEFQGGESLLNFEMVKYIVAETQRRNDGRTIEYVIATNLSPLTDEHLQFCREHSIFISTSVDGPADLHNANRPKPGMDAHERVTNGIKRVRDALGKDSVSALMTTTAKSLPRVREIIDEYLRLGFHSVFLRPISPYGFAVRSAAKIGYETSAFLDFYREGLAYVLELNKKGVALREDYSAIVLRKMLTPFATGYVDLQSPSGIGISVIVYNYDGDVYASDEGRMLAETGDKTFRLGNVFKNTYEEIFLDSPLIPTIYDTMAEGTPMCTDCAFLPWCGTDPVYHHATQGDVVGHRPTSGFCARNMGVFRELIETMEKDPHAKAIMRRWL